MKAVLCTAFGPIDTLRIDDVAIPEPGAGQVRVRVKAASLNFPDALIVQGLYQVKPALPFSPGAEFAGVIDAVVAFTGHGGFAEQCLADARQIAALPPGMTFEQGAALVLAYGTSLHALQQRARLQAGETLLVLGAAGGVGLAAIEIAKALGARVIAAASSADKLALCRAAGADDTIDYATEDLRRRVDELTGGRGADVVYDPVGGAYTEAALRATAWRGRFLVVGFAAGEIPKIALNLALLKERDILGVFWGDAVRRDPAQHAANMRQLAQWFATGKIRPAITERVPLAHAIDAIARIANRQVKGKVVILPEA
ncbi:NADPH:quinone oxidoreductase family protein [Burkholderia multivorans]|uniref:NADPH:quinone oxidoreductase family protein n=1 Tax=Burkholderia multivorans TaxID=87883 RepID=UPI001C20FB1D|nr:NADPH:quinone oxidoreductase family protein [Burkholderia multivorans]MBU9317880.1 NADPH:quinone oxidoreductase family protein [Burkholderia multivorans]MDN7939710.1 NADPH:quinone oxidoreductase family protein [Burkholderia multivorans]